MERRGKSSLDCYTEKPCVLQSGFTRFFVQGLQGVSSRDGNGHCWCCWALGLGEVVIYGLLAVDHILNTCYLCYA